MGRLTLGAIALPAAVAIAGAFAGADRAAAVFNSIPMAVYWVGLTALLATACVTSRSLRRRPGLAAAHAGCVAVLVGAMIGSADGQALRGRLGATTRPAEAYMGLAKHHASDLLVDADGETLSRLPFEIYLDDFWTDYHAPADLAVILPTDDDGDGDATAAALIPWQVGREMAIPGAEATVRVLQYLPSASVAFAPGAQGRVRIRTVAGESVTLAGEVGAAATLTEPAVTVRVLRVFGNLRRVLIDGRPAVADVGGPPARPAVLLAIETADDEVHERLLYAGLPLREPPAPGVEIAYDFPPPTGATADPSSHTPAMEIEIAEPGRTRRRWLLADPMWRDDSVRLGPDGRGPTLLITREPTPPKAYRSVLVVLVDGRETRRMTVDVGRPMRYGGYHFYQNDQPYGEDMYATLTVRSDAGLTAVYVGFGLLAAGVTWRLWGRPVWAWARKRGGP